MTEDLHLDFGLNGLGNIAHLGQFADEALIIDEDNLPFPITLERTDRLTGNWHSQLLPHRPTISAAASASGRFVETASIQPNGAMNQSCSCVVIGSSLIITAAHVADNFTAEQMTLDFASGDLSNDPSLLYGLCCKVITSGSTIDSLDYCVIRVFLTEGRRLPTAPTLMTSTDGEALLERLSNNLPIPSVAIGYPIPNPLSAHFDSRSKQKLISGGNLLRATTEFSTFPQILGDYSTAFFSSGGGVFELTSGKLIGIHCGGTPDGTINRLVPIWEIMRDLSINGIEID
jgi:hypothetical protein